MPAESCGLIAIFSIVSRDTSCDLGERTNDICRKVMIEEDSTELDEESLIALSTKLAQVSKATLLDQRSNRN